MPHTADTFEITQLGDADYVAYQRLVEEACPEATIAEGGGDYELNPPF